VELDLATRRPSSSVRSASTKATLLPPETTRAAQVRVPPARTGAKKLIFISALEENTFLPRAQVTAEAPMAESQQAARKPPWMRPTGLVKRSSAGIRHVVRPGSDFSMQIIPRVRSQLGGTCTRGSATSRRYRTTAMASASASVVRAATVFSASGPVSPGEVLLEKGLITAVRPATGPATHEVLAPGFIDLQMNGIGPVDVATAGGDDWDVLDGLLLAQGVTTWCPTLISAPRAEMEASLGRVTEAAVRPARGRPAIAGAHLEGPFLAIAGAHRPAYLAGSVDGRWLGDLDPAPAVVTLAPELRGAVAGIEQLVAGGVLVALGHSACDLETGRRAADAGARLVTHLGNAMGRFDQRAPGLLGAALSDDRLAVSLIADLVHIHPALVRIAFRSKGADRTVLVTDAVAVADSATNDDADSDAGDLGRSAGHPPRMADGTLVGSVLRMDRAVANTVNEAGVALADAIAAASSTPATLLGLLDRGEITPGRRADLVALGPDLAVEKVWIGGETAWPGRPGAGEGGR